MNPLKHYVKWEMNLYDASDNQIRFSNNLQHIINMFIFV
jgi:hypothetical protein